jgi:hypothetical protein
MADEAAEPSDKVEDDTRRRFREALERKKQASHRSNDARGSGDKGVGHSQVLSGKRQFRRKSG